MSRIGKKPIPVPAGVETSINGNVIVVKGSKGELQYNFDAEMTVKVEEAQIVVERPSESKRHRTIHGTTRANINNLVIGVSEGYKKVLLINGVGS